MQCTAWKHLRWKVCLSVGLAYAICGLGSQTCVQAQAAVATGADAVAVLGEPFGVARIRYAVTPQPASESPPPVRVRSPQGRVFYPTVRQVTQTARTGPPLQEIPPGRGIGRGRLLGRITNAVRTLTSETYEQTIAHEVWFLFRGREPLTVTVDDGQSRRFTLQPVAAAPTALISPLGAVEATFDHEQAIAGWWEAYQQAAGYGLENGDYPPLVESYLVSMLGRRLGLPLSERLVSPSDDEEEDIASTLELVAGTEKMRTEIFQRVATGDTEQFQAADYPLPDPPQWSSQRNWEALEQQLADEGVSATDPADMEPMARRVPIDSLYLRFGSFQNYLWFRDLGNRHGGDITRMVTLRGFDYQATARTETLLNLQTSELAATFGPAVVDDMALIGHDLFLTEGPSLGVLFRAKNAFLLSTSLRSERSTAAKKLAGAELRDVRIDDRDVSFLSTPDNRVRSFMVVDGDYILVSSSEALVREFLAVGRGDESLADSRGFQMARRLMPANNDYAIFAYFSDRFFQNLVSPRYQIELRRRLYASADIALARLATLAAQHEGKTIDQVDQLTSQGYLPAGMGQRPDGSGLIIAGPLILDSRRGRLGSFVPITDVALDKVTEEEFAWYQRRAAFYSEQWKQMDPLVAGIRPTQTTADGVERVEIHAEVAPLVPEKYGWIARQLGPPTKVALQFAPDDIITVQAHVESDKLGGTIPPHHLFLAIKDDLLPNPAELDGILDTYFALKSLAGYLGAWPQPGVLDRLPLGLGRGRPVGPGMRRLIGGLYRFQGNGFSIVSFMPEIITASLPHLAIIEEEMPAQVRLKIGNLHGSQLEAWLNQQLYTQNYLASIAGGRLLDAVTTQLGVPAEQAEEVVNELIDAKLQCPLGGEYRLVTTAVGPRWQSSAIDRMGNADDPPVGYLAPVLTWFRGATGRLTQYDARLIADLVVDVATE